GLEAVDALLAAEVAFFAEAAHTDLRLHAIGVEHAVATDSCVELADLGCGRVRGDVAESWAVGVLPARGMRIGGHAEVFRRVAHQSRRARDHVGETTDAYSAMPVTDRQVGDVRTIAAGLTAT